MATKRAKWPAILDNVPTRCRQTVRLLPKFVLAVAAIVFFGTTVAGSIVFSDATVTTSANDAMAAEVSSRSMALVLAILACVGYLAGRRAPR